MRQVTMIMVTGIDLAQLKAGQNLLLDIGNGKQLELMFERAVGGRRPDFEENQISEKNGNGGFVNKRQRIRDLLKEKAMTRLEIIKAMPDVTRAYINGTLYQMFRKANELIKKQGKYYLIDGKPPRERYIEKISNSLTISQQIKRLIKEKPRTADEIISILGITRDKLHVSLSYFMSKVHQVKNIDGKYTWIGDAK